MLIGIGNHHGISEPPTQNPDPDPYIINSRSRPPFNDLRWRYQPADFLKYRSLSLRGDMSYFGIPVSGIGPGSPTDQSNPWPSACHPSFSFPIYGKYFDTNHPLQSFVLKMLPLRCAAQNYDWGRDASSSSVADLAKANGASIDESKPFAELW
jgi:hypothetical protein